jgi:small-conductance mechanosensitive channel
VPELYLLDRIWYGNSGRQWLIALATFGAVYIVLAFARRVAVHRLGAIAARSATRFDDLGVDLITRMRQYFLIGVALYAATRLLVLPENARGALQLLLVAVVLAQAGRWGNGLIGFAVEGYLRKNTEGDPGARATVQAVGYAARFVLWAILLIMALAAFGIDVTALITGLGIGGIAIALAVQNILGDLFAALSIVLDKPFVVGDFIIVDATMGTVEHVGLKTTRIRSLSGEQIIVSNGELLKSRIRNYKRMEQRRVVFGVDVLYDTPPDQLQRIPLMIREIVEQQSPTRFDRSHLLTLADSALRFETVYWVLAADFNVYADIQHAVLVELVRRFNAEGIGFAFPSRTIYMNDPQNTALT